MDIESLDPAAKTALRARRDSARLCMAVGAALLALSAVTAVGYFFGYGSKLTAGFFGVGLFYLYLGVYDGAAWRAAANAKLPPPEEIPLLTEPPKSRRKLGLDLSEALAADEYLPPIRHLDESGEEDELLAGASR